MINKRNHDTVYRCKNSEEGDDAIVRSNSLCELKAHFIVKEYYGVPRRESQTFYIEEKLRINGNIDNIDNIDNGNSNAIIQYSIPRLLVDNIALFGGAVVGGAFGLWLLGKTNTSIE